MEHVEFECQLPFSVHFTTRGFILCPTNKTEGEQFFEGENRKTEKSGYKALLCLWDVLLLVAPGPRRCYVSSKVIEQI